MSAGATPPPADIPMHPDDYGVIPKGVIFAAFVLPLDEGPMGQVQASNEWMRTFSPQGREQILAVAEEAIRRYRKTVLPTL